MFALRAPSPVSPPPPLLLLVLPLLSEPALVGVVQLLDGPQPADDLVVLGDRVEVLEGDPFDVALDDEPLTPPRDLLPRVPRRLHAGGVPQAPHRRKEECPGGPARCPKPG